MEQQHNYTLQSTVNSSAVRLRIMHSAQWWARITDSESGIPSRAFLPFPFFTVRDLYHHTSKIFAYLLLLPLPLLGLCSIPRPW
jgi:hypothetical protein